MIAILSLLVGLAHADDPCDRQADGYDVGPVSAAIRDGGLATPRRICPRSTFAAGLDARATIDTANFYGYLVGSLDLDGSYAIRDDVEVFGRLEAVRADYAVASVRSLNLGLGHLQLGVTWAPRLADSVRGGLRVRTVLPTNTGLYRNSAPMGIDLAFGTVWSPNGWLRLHNELGVATTVVLGRPAPADVSVTANLGLETRIVTEFGLALDVDASAGSAGLDYVSAGLGLRFSDGKRFGFELGGRVPLAGNARELALIGMRGTVRFGTVGEGVAAL